MDEAQIRELVESRKHDIYADVSWFTPSGRERSAPIYEAEIENEYLKKNKTIKAKSEPELNSKINACLEIWNEQEIRKRIVGAKRDAKEQGQAEATRLDTEAKETIAEANGLLAATLAIDDRIDWDGERDTREFKRFSYGHTPQEPKSAEPVLRPKPGLTWIFRWRLRRWNEECDRIVDEHEQATRRASEAWQAAVQKHLEDKAAAQAKHAEEKKKFLADQERANQALVEFRQRFEAGEVSAIVEYCSRVLERSQYPDFIELEYDVGFDEESAYVTVDFELPAPAEAPSISGYKFVARGNKAAPILLKKKEAATLYESILDQLAIRTVHEIVEGCYVEKVSGVQLNGWVTQVDEATGQDQRKRVRTIVTTRSAFESLDLSRIEPAACIKRLAASVGQMDAQS